MCELCFAIGSQPVCGNAPELRNQPLESSNGGVVSNVTGFEERFKGADLANMQALVSGLVWNSPSLTYSFPDSISDYGSVSSYGNSELSSGFSELNLAQKGAARDAFDMISSFTQLNFTEVTDNDGSAILRLAESSVPSTAWAYYPHASSAGGDAWFNGSGWYDNPVLGTYAHHTFMHEIGHALGLKHGHDASGYGKLDTEHDQMAYSLMTYKSYEGASGSHYTNEYYGYAQSFMAYDIAALQALYGANWEYESGDTLYTFSQYTGEMSINGTGIGAPASNRIFRTIWDGGGEDTIDLSNYNNNVVADLNSGGSLDFSATQRVQLGGGIYSDANVYLAVSIANQIDAGGGNDAIYGLGGDDFIFGGGGKDTIIGGPEDDILNGGAGRDKLKGSAGADLFVLDATSSKDVALDFTIGLDYVDVPDTSLATLTVSNTGHLTVEYLGAWMVLRRLDTGDATVDELVI